MKGFDRFGTAVTLARLQALRSDLIDPTISLRHGRVVPRLGGSAAREYAAIR
jgi:adenylate cyclase